MSSNAPANTLHKLQVSFLLANTYAAAQEQLCMLVTRSAQGLSLKTMWHWCQPRHATNCKAVLATQSSVPVHELIRAQEQRRKGQPVEITGWMKPSADVTVPAATLLSEVRRIKPSGC